MSSSTHRFVAIAAAVAAAVAVAVMLSACSSGSVVTRGNDWLTAAEVDDFTDALVRRSEYDDAGKACMSDHLRQSFPDSRDELVAGEWRTEMLDACDLWRQDLEAGVNLFGFDGACAAEAAGTEADARRLSLDQAQALIELHERQVKADSAESSSPEDANDTLEREVFELPIFRLMIQSGCLPDPALDS